METYHHVKAYKLFRLRKDGSLGPLFINAKQRVPIDRLLVAENHPTKGFAVRPGWHCSHLPLAPHLSKKGRVWCEVEAFNVTEHKRPTHQGGLWYVARAIRVIRKLDDMDVWEILGDQA